MVDARTEEGREIIRKLADTADVFLTNVRPGGMTYDDAAAKTA